MRACILMGSPRKNGNTAAILSPFCEELSREGYECETVWLYEKQIAPCMACRTCQADWSHFGCKIQDDACELFDRVLACDLLVLATPVYSWYCTPPMKSLLDRFVYGMNKYYGEKKGPSLWEGKKVALIVTCGYPVEKGADLLEEGIRRYCRHSRLSYIGCWRSITKVMIRCLWMKKKNAARLCLRERSDGKNRSLFMKMSHILRQKLFGKEELTSKSY